MIFKLKSCWFHKCSQHLLVTNRSYSCCLSIFLTEIKAPNAAISARARHRNPFRMQNLLMQFSWIKFCPISEVLFINCTWQLEMGFVACHNDSIRFETYESKSFFTATPAISQMIFSKLLHSLNFVGIEHKVKAWHSSYRSVRIFQGISLNSGWARWWFESSFFNNLDVFRGPNLSWPSRRLLFLGWRCAL